LPKWVHDRARHIQAKNPSMPESEAFACATQQAHAVKKSPKDYGTPQGRHEAKQKYDTPKDDAKTADPGGLSKTASFSDISESLGESPDRESVEMDRLKLSPAQRQYIDRRILKSTGINLAGALAGAMVAKKYGGGVSAILPGMFLGATAGSVVNRALGAMGTEKTAELFSSDVSLLAPLLSSFTDELTKIANLGSGHKGTLNPTRVGGLQGMTPVKVNSASEPTKPTTHIAPPPQAAPSIGPQAPPPVKR